VTSKLHGAKGRAKNRYALSSWKETIRAVLQSVSTSQNDCAIAEGLAQWKRTLFELGKKGQCSINISCYA